MQETGHIKLQMHLNQTSTPLASVINLRDILRSKPPRFAHGVMQHNLWSVQSYTYEYLLGRS